MYGTRYARKLLLEMSDEYPELSRVFVSERDQF
jgi:hypothetical protein